MSSSKAYLPTAIIIAIHLVFIVEGDYPSVFGFKGQAQAQSTISEEETPALDDKTKEEDLLTLMTDIGFTGGKVRCKLNQWVPLVVTVDNRLKNVEGVIVLTRPRCDEEPYETNYSFPVKSPKESNKKFMFYVPAEENRVFRERYFEEIPWSWKATLVYEGEADLPMAIGDVDDSVYEDRQLVLVVSDISSGYELLGKHSRASIHLHYRRTRGIAYSQADLLPLHWIGYSGVDTVILDNLSESVLSEAQQIALRDYVLLGGNLVVSAGKEWPQMKRMLLADVLPLPIELTGNESVLEAASVGKTLTQRYGGAIGPDQRLMIYKSKAKGGKVVLAHEEIPLIVEKNVGMGWIVFVAFSLTDPVLLEWEGRTRLADDILRSRSGALLNDELYYSLSLGFFRRETPRRSFTGMPADASLRGSIATALSGKNTQIRFFPRKFVAYFLGFYIILLVPMNYIAFKKIGTEFAWLAVPALAISFALVAYIIGYYSRGRNIAVNQVSIVQTAEDCPIGMSSDFFGIYAPGETKTDVLLQDSAAFVSHLKSPGATRGMETQVLNIELGGWTASGERPSLIRGLRIPPAAIRMFEATSTAALGNGFKKELRLTDNWIVGDITNESGFDLKRCVLITAGREWASVGDIASGSTIEVEEECSTSAISYSGNDSERLGFEESLLRRVVTLAEKLDQSRDSCYLVGWSESPVLRVKLSRNELIKPSAKSAFVVKMTVAR